MLLRHLKTVQLEDQDDEQSSKPKGAMPAPNYTT